MLLLKLNGDAADFPAYPNIWLDRLKRCPRSCVLYTQTKASIKGGFFYTKAGELRVQTENQQQANCPEQRSEPRSLQASLPNGSFTNPQNLKFSVQRSGWRQHAISDVNHTFTFRYFVDVFIRSDLQMTTEHHF